MVLRGEGLFQDLRYGFRQLRRNAGFTTVAVFALALGIGVNTAVFTAYKAMVARPIDARDPGAIVNLALVRDSGAADFTFSYPDYVAYRDSVHSFSGLIAFSLEQMRISDAGGALLLLGVGLKRSPRLQDLLTRSYPRRARRSLTSFKNASMS